MKLVVCALTGEVCGEFVPMNKCAKPACETCTEYLEWAEGNETPDEYHKRKGEEFESWYVSDGS